MNRFAPSLRLALFATAALASSFALSGPAAAQGRPLPQKQLSRGAVSTVRATPQPKTLHLVYGTLRAVKGAALVLQTRRGASLRIDASAAIAAGTYSAPMFVGKIVAASGYYDTAHVMHASSVTRMTRLDPTTGPDR